MSVSANGLSAVRTDVIVVEKRGAAATVIYGRFRRDAGVVWVKHGCTNPPLNDATERQEMTNDAAAYQM